MPLCHLALGSNLGDRLAHLRAAIVALAGQGLPSRLLSSVYETSPVDAPGAQMTYLNAVVAVEAALAPHALVAACLVVEAALGRTRSTRHAPRVIDIDVLLCGAEICDDPRAVVPHPRLHERLFVLAPLRELAPELVHPRIGATIETLYQRCAETSTETVRLYAPPFMLTRTATD
jgi:2-amino-4-hydroxy-6-hydroxymethyldihydropteridine diphosphokinase